MPVLRQLNTMHPSGSVRHFRPVKPYRELQENRRKDELVNLGVCEPVIRPGYHIRHADVLALVLAVLSETFPCDHDRY